MTQTAILWSPPQLNQSVVDTESFENIFLFREAGIVRNFIHFLKQGKLLIYISKKRMLNTVAKQYLQNLLKEKSPLHLE